MYLPKEKLEKILEILRKGGVVVMPSDTIYGIFASALLKEAVGRVYEIKKRNPKKASIILLGEISQLDIFSIKLNNSQERIIKEFWPGRITLIFSSPSTKFRYLDRGKKSLAFRLPKERWLRKLIVKSGPLLAPSANPEGLPAAKTKEEARKYFGGKVDFYFGNIKEERLASTILDIRKRKIKIVRKGADFPLVERYLKRNGEKIHP